MKIETTLNQIPSLTWNWLKMNRGELKLETSLADEIKAEITGISEQISYEYKSSIDIPTMEEGLGKETDFIFNTKSETLYISSKENSKNNTPVILKYELKNDSSVVSKQVIHAKKNSEITVIIISTSENNTTGFEAISTKLFAEENAKINLIKVQLLGNNFVHLDSTSSVCNENANTTLTHIILGAKETFVGVKGDLQEYKSNFNSSLAYLCQNEQKLDMNYVVNHYGKKSECKMSVKGTLKDSSQKTYRGTIDFKNGCSGAIGDEQEDTLLLSPTVVNKSLPVILCDEEDVSGEHGATIGRLSEEVLFYMKSRGIAKNVAENIIARAKIQSVVSLIPDEQTVELIQKYMDGVFGDE